MLLEDFLPESDAASFLGLKVASLRNWSADKKGPPRIKIGRKIFYRREALVAWMLSLESTADKRKRRGV